MYYDATSVFEFGVGESTLIAAYVGVTRYSGVDSDAAWINKARSDLLLVRPSNNNNDNNMQTTTKPQTQYRFSFADIGPTRMFGNAIHTNVSKIPLSYQSTPLYSEMEAFDIYFIDGRYRVACACSAMLHAISRNANMSNVLFAVHDWSTIPIDKEKTKEKTSSSWRGYDTSLLTIGTIVHKSTKLAVLKVKTNVTAVHIAQIWKENIWSTW